MQALFPFTFLKVYYFLTKYISNLTCKNRNTRSNQRSLQFNTPAAANSRWLRKLVRTWQVPRDRVYTVFSGNVPQSKDSGVKNFLRRSNFFFSTVSLSNLNLLPTCPTAFEPTQILLSTHNALDQQFPQLNFTLCEELFALIILSQPLAEFDSS